MAALLYFSLFGSLLIYLQFFHFLAVVFWLNQLDDVFLTLLAGFDLHLVNEDFHIDKLTVTFLFFSLSIFFVSVVVTFHHSTNAIICFNFNQEEYLFSTHEVKFTVTVAVLNFICISYLRSSFPFSFETIF